MKIKAALLILSLALCVLPLNGARAQSSEAPPQFRKGEVVVEIHPGASIDAVNARIGTRIKQRLYGTNFYLLTTPKNKKENKFRKRLQKDPDVLSASLNPVVTNLTLFGRSILTFPDTFAVTGKTREDFESQQGLFDFLNLVNVHLRSRGRGAIIALIDTGVDLNHQAIGQYIWTDNVEAPDGVDNDNDGLIDDTHGWDFVDGDNLPNDVVADPQESVAGHGTFIAGIISLVAPEARIMPVRAFPPDGYGDEFAIASAIKYATDNGANIINLSFGADQVSSVLADAITYAKENGVLMIAASGNENSEKPQYPAISPDVLAVSAIDLASHKAQFSNFGPHVDVSAPGVQLISAYPGASGDGYALWSGTSFAAPFAVAEAALIRALDPDHPDIKKAIEDNAINIDGENPGFAGKLGRGRINILKALECLNTDCTRTPRDFHAEASLVRAPGVTFGQGRAKVSVSGQEQEFELTATGLNPRASYNLAVNGVRVEETLRPGGSYGDVKFRFSNDGSDAPLPSAMNPVTNIRQVELRDEGTGQTILAGSFPRVEDAPPLGQRIEKEVRLTAAGGTTSGGKAKIQVESERESLTVEAEKLLAGQAYAIIVDGVALAQGNIALGGYFKATFTSDGSSGRFLPPGLRPAVNIRHVEIRNQAGEVVLQGDFSSATNPGGGSPTPTGEREADFSAVSETSAEGKTQVSFGPGYERFRVELKELEASSTYTIVVDTTVVGAFRAGSAGRIKLEWSNGGESDTLPLPASIRPVWNIRRVQIRTSTGIVILSASFVSPSQADGTN
jgi:hypothetical protein